MTTEHNDDQSFDGQHTDTRPYTPPLPLSDRERKLALLADLKAEDVTPADRDGYQRAFHATWTAAVALHREDKPRASTVLNAAADVLDHDDAQDGLNYHLNTYKRALRLLSKHGLTEDPAFTEAAE